MITGVTIAEYLRRRRMTLAAQEIMSGDRVIDVAIKYGYESLFFQNQVGGKTTIFHLNRGSIL